MPDTAVTSPELHADSSMLVADLVTQAPPRAAVFERLGIEYCCGGRVPLTEACAEKDLDVADVVSMLDDATASLSSNRDWSTASIEELVTDIVETHHGYVRVEMPRVVMLAQKVARAHGSSNPKLATASREVELLASELDSHMASEEEISFPICLRIAAGDAAETADTTSMVDMLMHDHTEIAGHLERLRELLEDYVPPASACTSYRAYLDALERLELDIHQHVHKENHILFPKVIDLVGS